MSSAATGVAMRFLPDRRALALGRRWRQILLAALIGAVGLVILSEGLRWLGHGAGS